MWAESQRKERVRGTAKGHARQLVGFMSDCSFEQSSASAAFASRFPHYHLLMYPSVRIDPSSTEFPPPIPLYVPNKKIHLPLSKPSIHLRCYFLVQNFQVLIGNSLYTQKRNDDLITKHRLLFLEPHLLIGNIASKDLHANIKDRCSMPLRRCIVHTRITILDENSPRAETSASMDGLPTDEKIESKSDKLTKSSDYEKDKTTDTKMLRRLAQNREAARKSRLRKKAYVQQLESSRVKLNLLEQEVNRVRQQGVYTNGDMSRSMNAGAVAFNMDYARWIEEHNRKLAELRSALANNTGDAGDNDLHHHVDKSVAHYDELFCFKGMAVKADVFHVVSGMWKTPAERCFMWMGGFRPSELLKILIPQLQPLSEQQLRGICDLQQSCQEAEDALSQGMEALQQNLADTLSASSVGAPNVANYMGQMAMAMGKLGTLESFVQQADNLRQQTLHQMHRILTPEQAAKGLLAMGDYFSRLRALSSLWIARPRD